MDGLWSNQFNNREHKNYELDDYKTPSDEVVKHLQAIIDEAFGRSGQKDPVEK
jgi:hypothetical protein